MKQNGNGNHPQIEDMLQTKDKKIQAQRIQQLLSQAAAPVVSMTIQFDGRTGKITLLAPEQLTFDEAFFILEQTRQVLMKEQAEQFAASQATQPQPAGPQTLPPEPAAASAEPERQNHMPTLEQIEELQQ